MSAPESANDMEDKYHTPFWKSPEVMDTSWKNCFEEELLCPICLHVFEEPIQLPCKHNFCKGCISEAWARDNAAVRCPECNHDYEQKPTLEKNFKLANIAKRFNALKTEKVPAELHCVLCRGGPQLPVRKVCLRCKEPCCQTHIQMHLQQPCTAPGHLLVDIEELSAWTCPTHEEYRLLHCEEEQVALCSICCISHCTNQRHMVCNVDTKHIQMQAELKRQQDRLEGRVQSIDEQFTKLQSNRTLMKNVVSELKQQVRAQYQRMHMLLEANQAETVRMLENTFFVYVRENCDQRAFLHEKRQEAEKLLSSVHTTVQRSDSMNFMKNTKPYQLLMDRSNSHLSSGIPPLRVGQLNSHPFLLELSTREKTLQRVMEEPFNEVPILEIAHSSYADPKMGTSTGQLKRSSVMAFLESINSNSTSQDPPPFPYCSKKPHLDQDYRASSMYSSEGLSQNLHVGPSHGRHYDTSANHSMRIVSTSSHHSGSIFPPTHLSSGNASQQAIYEGRKLLRCTSNNCCCSRAPAARAHLLYPGSDSFPSTTSHEFPQHVPPSASQPLLHIPMRGPDFYGLHIQSSTKHYGTK